MGERLIKYGVAGEADILEILYAELNDLTKRDVGLLLGNHGPLQNCCSSVYRVGLKTVVIQRRVHDPDFLAEYGAYYSRQFLDVPRFCSRIHFFKKETQDQEDLLDFLSLP